ncbi:hypothetical protein [Tenacibaculum finnmarkense]|uniref:hypothetical protein n=1 Tax=Tenacibaculum finnmarkense TaxID=2781243 RepID=UPI00187BA26D|nr:hypothetical protein [Tenacibaculum finnmarkense]MBE7659359.1 hypothetical protein [Tenacibaculum finnmarkense genomovar finnmarkense]MCG8251451.1 hypothetical protein [Tenacibaculum finnmarkense genomovar finnmarkense]MCG8814965.1 hypothetical protein [Tenacibaculum finnmarkense]MCG8820003.1 hypothetical protein [Tenacibaculum finnmarkense]
MDSWDLRNFRNDLSIFIELIKTNDVTGDFSDLDTLLSEIENKQLIEYSLENIMFYINRFTPVVKPENLNYCEIHLNHMLMTSDTLSVKIDPLHKYVFDISVSSFKSKNSTDKIYYSSWHHDRHMNTQNVRYIHPTYHFQFGGKKMELIDDEMAVLSSPRIPHPPMDIFLGFHFILSNYYNNKKFSFVNSLLEDIVYQNIIKRAQERLWTPYFKAFDSTNTHQDFTMNKLFPLYIN